MYYSVDDPISTLSDRAQLSPHEQHFIKRKRNWKLYAVLVGAVVLVGGVIHWYSYVDSALHPVVEQAAKPVVQAETNKPEVAGISFGDLLNQKRSYTGWMAGVRDGDVVVANPQSGELITLVDVENKWFGPISTLTWSPDHSKLAFVMLPEPEARGLSNDAVGFSKSLGLSQISQPQAFPFGKVVVLDVSTKQLVQTGQTIRNTPKNIIWLDDNRLAMITSSLIVYELNEGKVNTVAEAGVTNTEAQLQSPLAWDAKQERIFFTKVKNLGDSSVRLLVSVGVPSGGMAEYGAMRSGSFDEAAVSQGIDLALSDDGSRLGVLNDEGLGYISLADGGMHRLPYNTEWLWMKESVLSDLLWITPARLGFASLAKDGSKVWGVWDIPSTKLPTFGKGSLGGSWDKASGRLALIMTEGEQIGILTPNWENPAESSIARQELHWDALNW